MARLPMASLKPPGYMTATLLVSIAGLLNGYDTGSIGAVTTMPHFHATIGHLTPFLHGLTVSTIMLAGALPALYAGQLADRLGRLPTIAAGALLFALGAALQCSAPSLPQFIGGRALAGVGMGTWMSPMAVYITEIAPHARRGQVVSIPQLTVTGGICAGYFSCSAAVNGRLTATSDWSWRVIYVVQIGAALVLALTCRFLPESPRWCVLVGKRELAVRNLARLDFSPVEADKDVLGPAATRAVAATPGPIEGLLIIFRKEYRRRTALALVTLGLIQLSGIDGVLYYAPTLFAQAGLSATTASFVASGVSALLMFAITIPSIALADRFPRRAVMLTGGVILAGCMLTIGALYASGSVTPVSSARWVVVVAVFVFALTYCATWGLVGKVYASEIQPTQTRSSANSVAQGLGFFTNWLVAILTPLLLASSSFSAYFLFAAFCLVSVVLLWAFMPETRGQSLEAIEEAFKTPVAGGSKVARLIRRWFGAVGGSTTSNGGSIYSRGGSGVSLQDMLVSPGLPSRDQAEVEAGVHIVASTSGSIVDADGIIAIGSPLQGASGVDRV